MQKKLQTVLQIEFVRFCIVGASGFVINALLLTLLNKDLHSPFVSQLIAGEIALFSNFMFHNRWTYKARGVQKTMTKLIVQFHLASWVAIIGSAGLVTVGIKYLHLAPLIALAGTSAIALGWNFGWSRFVIWHKHAPKEEEETT